MNITSKGIEINDIFYSLKDITEKVFLKRIEEENLAILRIRAFSQNNLLIEECVVGNISDLGWLMHILNNQEIEFGDINGKYSEVSILLRKSNFEILKEKEEVVNFLKITPTGHSYNHSFIYSFIAYLYENKYEDDEYDEIL